MTQMGVTVGEVIRSQIMIDEESCLKCHSDGMFDFLQSFDSLGDTRNGGTGEDTNIKSFSLLNKNPFFLSQLLL